MILTHDRRRSLVLTVSAGLLILPLHAAAQQAPTSVPPVAAEPAPSTTLPAPGAPTEPPVGDVAPTPGASANDVLPATPPPPPPPPIVSESADAGGLEERVDAVEKRLDAIPPIKLSGYIQAQYTRNDTSTDAVDSSGKPLNKNLFDIRRARFKATYTLGFAEAVLDLDAVPTAVSLNKPKLNGHAQPAEGFKTKLHAGLFYTPFGYESQESDAVLPFVERSLSSNRLFPGQRELGIRAWADLFDQHLFLQAALTNGTSLSDAVFPGLDPNGAKDVIGRLGVKFGGLRAGVSGLAGTGYLPAIADDAKTMDVNEAHGLRNFNHRAAGFDVVYQVDLPVVGELALYAEGILSRDLDRSSIGAYPKVTTVTTDGVKSAGNGLVHSKEASGYVGFLQHLTQWAAVGVRGEIFDPNTSIGKNSIYGLLFVGHVYPHPSLRLTAGYQIYYETPKVKNNVLTLRAQVRY